ncbi:hypothetical protein NPIL_183781 [Nephila pilipes]|uniref:Uncharacterized protein n=1 Tax=Nephila pilipes TaxID=299642 RepID=A0A8X6KJB7_NEPPI|nr:hypothetical protein NPIL_183781 [Nephila pilipes]
MNESKTRLIFFWYANGPSAAKGFLTKSNAYISKDASQKRSKFQRGKGILNNAHPLKLDGLPLRAKYLMTEVAHFYRKDSFRNLRIFSGDKNNNYLISCETPRYV